MTIPSLSPSPVSRRGKMSPPKVGPRAFPVVSLREGDEVKFSAALARSKQKTDRVVGKALLTALAGAASLTCLAGPAMAQVPPGIEPLVLETVSQSDLFRSEPDLLRLDLPLEPMARDTTKTKFGVQLNSVNDFMPDAWTGWLGGPEHKIPDGTAFDDDGFTAEVQLLGNLQQGNEEWVMGGRVVMVTQPGSRYPFAEDYQGLRADIGEVVVQRNLRTRLSSETVLDYGVGGGLQFVGNVGGEDLQRWWHVAGPAGGRVGEDLQGNQVRDGFRAMPLMTGGAKLTHTVSPDLDVMFTTQASLPLGRGVGNIGFRAGLGKTVGPVNIEVGGKLDATWMAAPELDFHASSGLREGWYGRLEFEPGKWGGVYTQLETGGLRNEPVLTFGIRLGGGTGARLNPFW
ncbi:MAG TPA: hypothetical protein EYO33_26935 [Phycisphaerales bacterium]|nr:hypothetical protein [Phycisphaerales bacterium]